jgi:hypothetical protein
MSQRPDPQTDGTGSRPTPLQWLKRLSLGAAAAVVAGIGVAVAGWITHLIVAIQVLTSSTDLATTVGYAVLLVIGIVIPPIGALHGVGVWFGLF